MRILFVCAWLPPAVRPQAILAGRLIEALGDTGHDIFVVCETLDSDVTAMAIHSYAQSSNRWLKRFVQWMPLSASRRIQILYREMFVVVENIERKFGAPDVVVSFANPYRINVLGAWVSKKLGVPLVAHYSDPLLNNPYRGRSNKKEDTALEAFVLCQAKAVVTVNTTLRDWIRRAENIPVDLSVHAIPHSYVPNRGISSGNPPTRAALWRHMGAFYGPRRPEPLLRAIAQAVMRCPDLTEELRVELIGADLYGDRARVADAIEKENVEEVVVVLPVVSYAAAQSLMGAADVLICIDGDLNDSPFLPSKLIDYFASQAPIFCLTTTNSPASKVCDEIGVPWFDLRDPDVISEGILQVLRCPASFVPKPSRIERYQIQNVASEWSDCLANVTST